MRHLLVKIILGLSTSALIGGALATGLFSRKSLAKERHKDEQHTEDSHRGPSSMNDADTEGSGRQNQADPEQPNSADGVDHGFHRAGRTEGGR